MTNAKEQTEILIPQNIVRFSSPATGSPILEYTTGEDSFTIPGYRYEAADIPVFQAALRHFEGHVLARKEVGQ